MFAGEMCLFVYSTFFIIMVMCIRIIIIYIHAYKLICLFFFNKEEQVLIQFKKTDMVEVRGSIRKWSQALWFIYDQLPVYDFSQNFL